MKIAVVGCGALGSYYGSRLVRAGHETHFLLRSDYATVRRRGVRVVVGRLDLDDLPPVVAQCVDIGLPLLAGEVEVDGAAVEVGDDALGQARAGPADERDRRHGIRAGHEAGHSEW